MQLWTKFGGVSVKEGLCNWYSVVSKGSASGGKNLCLEESCFGKSCGHGSRYAWASYWGQPIISYYLQPILYGGKCLSDLPALWAWKIGTPGDTTGCWRRVIVEAVETNVTEINQGKLPMKECQSGVVVVMEMILKSSKVEIALFTTPETSHGWYHCPGEVYECSTSGLGKTRLTDLLLGEDWKRFTAQ